MSERRITISPKVDRKIYFRFRDLCHAHGISAERGVEQAMKDVLERAGVGQGFTVGFGVRRENVTRTLVVPIYV